MTVRHRRERERGERHELIISAARQLAEAEGWDAVTTRRLAERIEYSQPVLYTHFRGKDEIVRAVAEQGFVELAAALRAARAGADPGGDLAAVVRAYAEFGAANPVVYDAMFTRIAALPVDHEDTVQPVREVFAQLRAAFEPLASGTDPDLLAEIGWSAVHGLVTLSRGGRLPVEQHGQRVALLAARLAGTPVGQGRT